MIAGNKIKVLVVDDSALIRRIVTDCLEADPSIEVIGTADNGKAAVIKNEALNPDVITMDIEMPVMNGLESLKNIIETRPKPVIMMSVLTQYGAKATIDALALGAVDFIPKPSTETSMDTGDFKEQLLSKVKSAYGLKVKFSSEVLLKGIESVSDINFESKKNKLKRSPDKEKEFKVVGIGSSTGGPSALIKVFKGFPEGFSSPILVVQHIPEGYTKAFAERLEGDSFLNVKEAEDGDRVMPGNAYIAPGNSHMEIINSNDILKLKVFMGDKVSGHRPSIDVLFMSIAECCGRDSVGVIMTGMGRDGVNGLLNIQEKGGYTLAQDEETSVVYGMNRAAVDSGAVKDVVPLEEISKKIVEHL